MWASMMGECDVVRLLLDKGAASEVKDAQGYTAMMWASSQGNADTVRLLVERGAAIETANTKGETALQLSAKKGVQRLFVF